jgi:hypothetical protein
VSAQINPSGLIKRASTGVPGYTLADSTNTILTWTAPNDGQMHRAELWAIKYVTVVEVGGGVSYSNTMPNGDTNFYDFDAGNNPVGVVTEYLQPWNVLLAPGGTIFIAQQSALTSGASIIWAEIWGA